MAERDVMLRNINDTNDFNVELNFVMILVISQNQCAFYDILIVLGEKIRK